MSEICTVKLQLSTCFLTYKNIRPVSLCSISKSTKGWVKSLLVFPTFKTDDPTPLVNFVVSSIAFFRWVYRTVSSAYITISASLQTEGSIYIVYSNEYCCILKSNVPRILFQWWYAGYTDISQCVDSPKVEILHSVEATLQDWDTAHILQPILL